MAYPCSNSPSVPDFHFGVSSAGGVPGAPTFVAPIQTEDSQAVPRWTPNIDPSNVTVAWDRIADVLGYYLDVQDLDTGAWVSGLGWVSDPGTGNTVEVHLPTLVNGHEYLAACSALNPWGWGDAAFLQFVPGEAPSAPQFTTSANGGESPSGFNDDTYGTRPTFTWTAVENANYYWLIIYDGNNGWAQIREIQAYSTAYTLDGSEQLNPGGYYAATVEADNEQGNSAQSDPIYWTVAPVPLKTTWVAPLGTVGGVNPAQTTVAWTNQDHVLWWRLEVYDTFTSQDIFNQDLPVSETPLDAQGHPSYQLSLPDGHELIGVVFGMNNSGNGPASDYAFFSVNSLDGPPPAPTGLSPSGIADSTMPTFRWDPVQGAGYYQVVLWGDGGWTVNVDASQTELDFGTGTYNTALIQGQTYVWSVYPYNGFGCANGTTAVFSVGPPGPWPDYLEISDPNTGNFKLDTTDADATPAPPDDTLILCEAADGTAVMEIYSEFDEYLPGEVNWKITTDGNFNTNPDSSGAWSLASGTMADLAGGLTWTDTGAGANRQFYVFAWPDASGSPAHRRLQVNLVKMEWVDSADQEVAVIEVDEEGESIATAAAVASRAIGDPTPPVYRVKLSSTNNITGQAVEIVIFDSNNNGVTTDSGYTIGSGNYVAKGASVARFQPIEGKPGTRGFGSADPIVINVESGDTIIARLVNNHSISAELIPLYLHFLDSQNNIIDPDTQALNVSNWRTGDGLPASSEFRDTLNDGDNFRLELVCSKINELPGVSLKNLRTGEQINSWLNKQDGGTLGYFKKPGYRGRFLRLVSNDDDDALGGNQVLEVQLGDTLQLTYAYFKGPGYVNMTKTISVGCPNVGPPYRLSTGAEDNTGGRNNDDNSQLKHDIREVNIRFLVMRVSANTPPLVDGTYLDNMVKASNEILAQATMRAKKVQVTNLDAVAMSNNPWVELAPWDVTNDMITLWAKRPAYSGDTVDVFIVPGFTGNYSEKEGYAFNAHWVGIVQNKGTANDNNATNGLNSVFVVTKLTDASYDGQVLAHELGHILGNMEHDGGTYDLMNGVISLEARRIPPDNNGDTRRLTQTMRSNVNPLPKISGR